MSAEIAILTPVVTLVAWTMVMWAWMYKSRIPAIINLRIKLDRNRPITDLTSQLPPEVRWKGENYNHLMEQPTIFYAVSLALALLGEGNELNLYLAWAYVVLRVIHSLVQSLGNNIRYRFYVFTLSNIPLVWLTVNALLAVY